MLIAEDEALACLKVLVALAKADGKVKADEKKSLAAAISRLELPVGITADGLLAENVDVAAELAKITSPEAREQLYRSAHFMANADGTMAPEESTLLDRIDEVSAPSETLRAQMTTLAPPASGGTSLIDSLLGLFRSKS
jgi:tellurite resistance protein